MGNCLTSHNPQGEVVCIKPGKFSSPPETDSLSATRPQYKTKLMDPAGIRSAYPEHATNGGNKKIRLLVTKQELRELLSKRMSVEEMLAGFDGEGRYRVDFGRKWRPLLETIPEGSE
ncbi:hypothetical protein DITRI_Ditri07aG0112300 [Diplodiscus trichospermus]